MPSGDSPTGERRPKELAVVMVVGGIDMADMYEPERDVETEGIVAPRGRVASRDVGESRDPMSRRRDMSAYGAMIGSSFGLAALRF